MFKDLHIDRFNKNCLVITCNNGKLTYLAVPPGRNRVDILSLESIYSPEYHYKIKGLVIVTTDKSRYVLSDTGEKLDELFFNDNKVDFYVDDPNQP